MLESQLGPARLAPGTKAERGQPDRRAKPPAKRRGREIRPLGERRPQVGGQTVSPIGVKKRRRSADDPANAGAILARGPSAKRRRRSRDDRSDGNHSSDGKSREIKKLQHVPVAKVHQLSRNLLSRKRLAATAARDLASLPRNAKALDWSTPPRWPRGAAVAAWLENDRTSPRRGAARTPELAGSPGPLRRLPSLAGLRRPARADEHVPAAGARNAAASAPNSNRRRGAIPR